jgi:hypothetical protein
MMQLPNAIPDVEVLLDLTPEELGSKMLFLLRQWGQATFHPYNMSGELWGDTSLAMQATLEIAKRKLVLH